MANPQHGGAFALILSVGMLVDGAIVVTEYADRRLTGRRHPSPSLPRSGYAHGLACHFLDRHHLGGVLAAAVLARNNRRVYEVLALNPALHPDRLLWLWP